MLKTHWSISLPLLSLFSFLWLTLWASYPFAFERITKIRPSFCCSSRWSNDRLPSTFRLAVDQTLGTCVIHVGPKVLVGQSCFPDMIRPHRRRIYRKETKWSCTFEIHT